MGKLVPIIIFIIIVVNILRRIAEYNRKRPTTQGDWTEWTAADGEPSTRPPAPPRPTPSDRVREILEQLAQGEASPPPPAAPLPPPLPTVRPPPVAPAPPPLPVPRPSAYAAPAARRYLTEKVLAEPQAEAVDSETAAPPLPARLPAADALYRESLSKAFPPAMAIIRGSRAQGRPPFAVRLRGRRSLRQAIVLAEVLGPPRAFDL